MNAYGITGFFNARQDGDQHAKSIFSGIDGETAEAVISDLPTFLEAAGRDYGILRKPALIRDPFGGVNEDGEVIEAVREVENQFHLTRTNDGRVVSPHTVTAQYAPLTLLDVAAEIQPWCDAGWVTPDAVYSGKNESLELLCLRMDASGDLPNDLDWKHYIVIRLPHGSGGKAKGTYVHFSPTCSNAFGSLGRGREFVIGHRISAQMTDDERHVVMGQRAKEAKEAWASANDHIAKVGQRINRWINAPVSMAQAELLTDTLLKITSLDDASTRKKNVRESILDGFQMPQFGTEGATLFDWLNGVTFVNSSPHSDAVSKSSVSPVDRIIRNVDPNGSGYKLEAKAYTLADQFLSGPA